MKVGSKEHYDVIAQFDVEFRGQCRLDKERKELWKRGLIYQSGESNVLFIAYIRGYAFGKAVQPMTHTLTLKSTGRVDLKRRESKYNASCSCGMWHGGNMIASEARESYDRHMQAVSGVEAQDAATAARESIAQETRWAYVTPVTTDIRYRFDGVEPTAMTGVLLRAGDTLELEESLADRFVYFPLTKGGEVRVVRSPVRIAQDARDGAK